MIYILLSDKMYCINIFYCDTSGAVSDASEFDTCWKNSWAWFMTSDRCVYWVKDWKHAQIDTRINVNSSAAWLYKTALCSLLRSPVRNGINVPTKQHWFLPLIIRILLWREQPAITAYCWWHCVVKRREILGYSAAGSDFSCISEWFSSL